MSTRKQAFLDAVGLAKDADLLYSLSDVQALAEWLHYEPQKPEEPVLPFNPRQFQPALRPSSEVLQDIRFRPADQAREPGLDPGTAPTSITDRKDRVWTLRENGRYSRISGAEGRYTYGDVFVRHGIKSESFEPLALEPVSEPEAEQYTDDANRLWTRRENGLYSRRSPVGFRGLQEVRDMYGPLTPVVPAPPEPEPGPVFARDGYGAVWERQEDGSYKELGACGCVSPRWSALLIRGPVGRPTEPLYRTLRDGDGDVWTEQEDGKFRWKHNTCTREYIEQFYGPVTDTTVYDARRV